MTYAPLHSNTPSEPSGRSSISRVAVNLDCKLCGGIGRIRTFGGYVRCYLCNFEIHQGVQPCEEAYPAARIRQCGRLKQGTADGSRTPLIAEATGRRAAVNRPPVRSAPSISRESGVAG